MSGKSRRDERGAYRHDAEITGAVDADTPELEHRDPAVGDAESRNEIDVEARNREAPKGPTTHDSLREVREERSRRP
jgi:hypothetical protein